MINTIFQSFPMCQIYTGLKDEGSIDDFVEIIVSKNKKLFFLT